MKTNKLLQLIQQKKFMRSGGALPLPKAQTGKSVYAPIKQPFQFSPMTEYEKEESNQPNLPFDEMKSVLYNYNERNRKYNEIEQINKSKQDYFDYLDSPAYLATAKKMWGDDAILNIEKQKSKIQNTPIVPYWDMDLTDRIKIIQDPNNIAEYDAINKRILNYTGNDLAKKHELSHATDAKAYPSDMWLEEYSEDGDNSFITRKYNLNPKYNDVSQDYLLLDDDFKEWDKRFKSDGSHDSMPTEIRAYVNTLRQKMFSDGIDWNNLNDDQIIEYVKKYDGRKETNPELQKTIDGLKNKENQINTEKLKAIRELAYNSNNTIMNAAKGGALPKAQTGKQKGPNVYISPNILNSNFNPLSGDIYLNRAQAYQQDVLPHEMEHYNQWMRGDLRVNPDQLLGVENLPAELNPSLPLRRPSIVANESFEGQMPYYNRRAIDQETLGNEFLYADPSFQFVNPGLIYDKVVNPEMYEVPWSAEGQAQDAGNYYVGPPYPYERTYKKGGLLPIAQNGKPIYVTNPNDPRLKAYTDSLSNYNYTLKVFDALQKYDYLNKNSQSVYGKLTNSYPKNNIEPVSGIVTEDYVKENKLQLPNPRAITIPVYKKPVQPIIYKKEELKPIDKKVELMSTNEQDEELKPMTRVPTSLYRREINPDWDGEGFFNFYPKYKYWGPNAKGEQHVISRKEYEKHTEKQNGGLIKAQAANSQTGKGDETESHFPWWAIRNPALFLSGFLGDDKTPEAKPVETKPTRPPFDYDTYSGRANAYLSRPVFKGTTLTGQMIADSARDFYNQTGYEYPLDFLLSQGQFETGLGTKLKSKNNFFNVGNFDDGRKLDYKTPQESINAYINLMYNDYLNKGQIKPEQLLQPGKFVNAQGKRYASNPNYEKNLADQSSYIKKSWLEEQNKKLNSQKKIGGPLTRYQILGEKDESKTNTPQEIKRYVPVPKDTIFPDQAWTSDVVDPATGQFISHAKSSIPQIFDIGAPITLNPKSSDWTTDQEIGANTEGIVEKLKLSGDSAGPNIYRETGASCRKPNGEVVPECASGIQLAMDYGTDMGGENRKRLGITGDAWTMGQNVVDAGGERYYSLVGDDLNRSSLHTNKDVKNYLDDRKKELGVKPLDIYNSAQAGDLVEMWYENSPSQSKALNQGKGAITTHIGIVSIKNGKKYVTHNIHGHWESNPLQKAMRKINVKEGSSVMVSGLVRPDYLDNSKALQTVGVQISPKARVYSSASEETKRTPMEIDWKTNTALGRESQVFTRSLAAYAPQIQQDFGLSDQEMQELMKTSFGLFAKESGFAEGEKFKTKQKLRKIAKAYKDIMPDWMYEGDEISAGKGQIKINEVFNTDEKKALLEKYGITKDNIWDTGNSAAALLLSTAMNYKNLSGLIGTTFENTDAITLKNILALSHNKGLKAVIENEFVDNKGNPRRDVEKLGHLIKGDKNWKNEWDESPTLTAESILKGLDTYSSLHSNTESYSNIFQDYAASLNIDYNKVKENFVNKENFTERQESIPQTIADVAGQGINNIVQGATNEINSNVDKGERAARKVARGPKKVVSKVRKELRRTPIFEDGGLVKAQTGLNLSHGFSWKDVQSAKDNTAQKQREEKQQEGLWAQRDNTQQRYNFKEGSGIAPELTPLQIADEVTDMMQMGHFVPHPAAQWMGLAGDALGAGIDSYQAGQAYAKGDYDEMATNLAFAVSGAVLGGKGYRRDMWGTSPGSFANRIARLGSREGTYIPLIAAPRLANNPVIQKGIMFNRGLLLNQGLETAYDSQYGETVNNQSVENSYKNFFGTNKELMPDEEWAISQGYDLDAWRALPSAAKTKLMMDPKDESMYLQNRMKPVDKVLKTPKKNMFSFEQGGTVRTNPNAQQNYFQLLINQKNKK